MASLDLCALPQRDRDLRAWPCVGSTGRPSLCRGQPAPHFFADERREGANEGTHHVHVGQDGIDRLGAQRVRRQHFDECACRQIVADMEAVEVAALLRWSCPSRTSGGGRQPLCLPEQQSIRGVWLRQSVQDKPSTFWHRQTPPGALRFRIERHVVLIQCLSKIRRRKSRRYFVDAQLAHVAPDQPYNPVVLADAGLVCTRQGIRLRPAQSSIASCLDGPLRQDFSSDLINPFVGFAWARVQCHAQKVRLGGRCELRRWINKFLEHPVLPDVILGLEDRVQMRCQRFTDSSQKRS